jgi:hypothetical protein
MSNYDEYETDECQIQHVITEDSNTMDHRSFEMHFWQGGSL